MRADAHRSTDSFLNHTLLSSAAEIHQGISLSSNTVVTVVYINSCFDISPIDLYRTSNFLVVDVCSFDVLGFLYG